MSRGEDPSQPPRRALTDATPARRHAATGVPTYLPAPRTPESGSSVPIVVKQRITTLSDCGHRAIPVRGKKPAVTSWPGYGPIPLHERWNWPYNRADRVGWVVPAGFVVLDLDVAQGASLEDLQQVVETTYGMGVPLAHIQRTRRGVHALFRVDRPVRCGTLRLAIDAAGRVDIKAARSGYVVLYDDAWALAADAAPRLPDALLDALDTPRERSTGPDLLSTFELPATAQRAVAARWSGFTGREGHRNLELNKAVFMACMAFEWDAVDGLEIRTLAIQAGLATHEVEATTQSAIRGASRLSARGRRWLQLVASLLRGGRYSAVEGPYRIARRLAYFAQFDGGTTSAMSYREISELLVVSLSTAHTYVTRLKELHLLAAVGPDGDERTEFALTYPDGTFVLDVSNSNSQPTPPYSGMGGEGNDDGAALEADLSVLPSVGHEWFAGHRAFHSAGLPSGAKPLLWALRSRELTREELVRAAGCSRASLQRYLKVVLAAGLVECRGRVVALSGPDLGTLLDAFAESSEAPDRREALRRTYVQQRQDYAEFRQRVTGDWWQELCTELLQK